MKTTKKLTAGTGKMRHCSDCPAEVISCESRKIRRRARGDSHPSSRWSNRMFVTADVNDESAGVKC
jgi:hypothetical protein